MSRLFRLHMPFTLTDSLIGLVSLIGAAGVALMTGIVGLLALVLPVGVLGVVIVLIGGGRVFQYALMVLLFGYIFASRGFASVGYYPLYISELVLALGVLTLVLVPFASNIQIVDIKRLLRPEIALLLLFIGWHLLQTIPYVSVYRFEALRDAMTFLYASYAFLFLLLIPQDWLPRFLKTYAWLLPLILLWIPFLYFNGRVGWVTFSFPGASVPFFFGKGTDLGSHLSGVLAFLLLNLYRPKHRGLLWFTWLAWLFAAAILASFGRSNMVAMVSAAMVVLILRPFNFSWLKPTLLIVFFVSVMLATNLYSTLSIDIGNERRVSLEQLTNNVLSIFVESDNSSLQDNKEWRVVWWDRIIDYTFEGPYFWTGKGYGVNLAVADGIRPEGSDLRSPHNGHLTYLARGGVPGFVLWALVVLSVLNHLLRQAVFHHNKYAIWVMAYLVALMVNASFDVLLEGPMGGIWFWVLVGIAFSLNGRDRLATARNPEMIMRGDVV